jgi:hypothetical protein
VDRSRFRRSKIGLHVALTPTWNETAYFADYVLPMGLASERHDLTSYETHSGMWISFRQPCFAEAARKMGRETTFTYETNPGEVWEEDEFLVRTVMADRPGWRSRHPSAFHLAVSRGEKITIDEYYQFIFENTKGLPEVAAKEGLTPLDYMRSTARSRLKRRSTKTHGPVAIENLAHEDIDAARGEVRKNGKLVAIISDGKARVGFNTPSKRQELFSKTTKDWGWPEYAFPDIREEPCPPGQFRRERGRARPDISSSDVDPHAIGKFEMARRDLESQSAVDAHSDAERWGSRPATSSASRRRSVTFVNRAWVTEGMRPSVVACSHHIGRWRRVQDAKNNRWSTNQVTIKEEEPGKWKMWVVEGIGAYKSDDPDTSRFSGPTAVFIRTSRSRCIRSGFGMHCWHQKVVVENGPRRRRAWRCVRRYEQVVRDLQGVARDDTTGTGSKRIASTAVVGQTTAPGGRDVLRREEVERAFRDPISGWFSAFRVFRGLEQLATENH